MHQQEKKITWLADAHPGHCSLSSNGKAMKKVKGIKMDIQSAQW